MSAVTHPTSVLSTGPGWIAIDKASGQSVHNDPESAIEELRRRLLQDQSLAAASNWDRDDASPSPVHRLDRETSGVLLLATRRESASRLQTTFADREVRKVYRAILRGDLRRDLPAETLEGSWDAPLTDKAEGRRDPAGPPRDRKPCLTRFRIVRANRHVTEIEVDLQSGRQHQIRRHAALAGRAVVNDTRYGEVRHKAIIEKIYGVSRLMLHAWLLEFSTNEGRVHIEAPLPPEFDRLFPDERDLP